MPASDEHAVCLDSWPETLDIAVKLLSASHAQPNFPLLSAFPAHQRIGILFTEVHVF